MQSATTGRRTGVISAMLGLIGMMIATPAAAVYDPLHQFIVNGDFESMTNGIGQLVTNTSAVGWTSAQDGNGHAGFNVVFNSATAATSGAPAEGGYTMKLWGGSNGLGASPTGGNFLGADGDYHVGQISQAITGLIVGESYSLTFNFAGAQERGYNGASSDWWNFGFTGQGLSAQTAVLSNVNHGFTGWQTQTYNFVATQTSDTLYFFAGGTPAGQPPFSLLDSVSLVGGFGTVSAAPDPATWMTLLFGFGIVGASLRLRRRSVMPARVFA